MSEARETTLTQVGADDDRPFALVDAGLDECLGETLIALQAVGDELLDGIASAVSASKPNRGQLVEQLAA